MVVMLLKSLDLIVCLIKRENVRFTISYLNYRNNDIQLKILDLIVKILLLNSSSDVAL